MIIIEEYLIIINARNKIQVVQLQLNQNPYNKIYTINRINYQYNGKKRDQPGINIRYGNQGRTIEEQAKFRYFSKLKQYLDKGYTKLSSLTSKPYSSFSEDELKTLLGGNFVSDRFGIPKPMLAKSADLCSADIWNKDWYVSRKVDGVRCLMYCKNNLIQTSSRGGGNYNVATKHLREDPILREIFYQNPDLILDGELYKHSADWPLQRISGTARLHEWNSECENLEYWIFDFIDTTKTFEERYKILKELKKIIPEDSKIKILEHKKLSGFLDIKKEHDKYVQEGFEGLCARNPDRIYGINKRSSIYLLKLKMRKDDEFKIIGVKPGLRDEDMCFILQTNNKKEFAAKPVGDTENRKYFFTHQNEFIGKMATCTYFTLSQDGIPIQPVLKSIRPNDE